VLKHVSNILLPLAYLFSCFVSDNWFVRHAKRYEPKLNLAKQLLLYITNNISDPVACSALGGKICKQTYQLRTLYRLSVLSFCSKKSHKNKWSCRFPAVYSQLCYYFCTSFISFHFICGKASNFFFPGGTKKKKPDNHKFVETCSLETISTTNNFLNNW